MIWITTAPVPFGYNVTHKGTTNGADASLPESQWRSIQFAHPDIQKENCGRKAGRMMAQNHWVKPILDKYPQVAVCDQWGMVYAQSKIKDSPFAKWMHGKNDKKTMEETSERYRKFLHVSPESYSPPVDFENPTPPEQRYRIPGEDGAKMTSTPESGTTAGPAVKSSSKEARWWTRPGYRLDATIVNYDEAEGKSARRRAKARIALAEQDLKQHGEWQTTGEVPEEQVEKARRIIDACPQGRGRSRIGKPE